MQAPSNINAPGRFSLTFLAEASQILSRSLDPYATVAEVVRLYVPLIADACTVDLFEAGTWRRAAAAHVDERLQNLMWQRGHALWAGPPPEGLEVLLAQGDSAHLIVLESDVGQNTPLRESQVHLLRSLTCLPECNAANILAVPLMAGGRIFGIMTLFCCDPKRLFLPEDIALAAELARRAATALDNARLYRDAERSRAQAEAARTRSQFLSHASEVLGQAAQYSEVVDNAAQLIVEGLATCCLIDLRVHEHQRVWAIAHQDPALAEKLRQWVQADRRALSLPEHTSTSFNGAAPTRQFWQQFAGLPRLTLPLWVRGEVHGTVTLVRSAKNAEAFDTETRLLAEEFLVRVASAIDRAWLFAEMKSAVAMRDEFLSIASHELRTPLTALELQLGNLQRLMAKPDSMLWHQRFSDKLQRATRQTGRLAKLIDNLLDVSRISAGRIHLECKPCDLRTICHELLERWGEAAALAHCALRFTPQACCMGIWDPLRLEQVVTNLLNNAIKYGAGQPIDIDLKRRQEGVCLSITNQGIGVAPAALNRIFERFERAVSPRDFGGLGLGLFISREIIQAHGGQIRVESTLGEGATFFVELPWQAPVSERTAELDIARDLVP